MKHQKAIVLLLFFIAIVSAAPMRADILQGQAMWSRTTSYARGWRVTDPYKLFSNAVLKDEATGSQLTLYVNAAKFDPTLPVRLEFRPAAPDAVVKLFDITGAPVAFKREAGGASVEVSAGEREFRRFAGFSIQVAGRTEATALGQIVLETTAEQKIEQIEFFYAPAGSSDRVDMAPRIAPPRFQPQQRQPEARLIANGFVLQNTSQSAEFSTEGGLHLKSLRNEYAGKNVLRDASQTQLFLTEMGDRRLGAQQWQVQNVRALSKTAVLVELHLEEFKLAAHFQASVNEQGLRLGLQMENQAAREQSWKTVFPHLGGLAISEQPEDDYYLYPLHGGLVQKVNANLRHFYGAANESLWQMMDIFSPAAGTGMSVRSLDENGLLKGMAFRKGTETPAYATKISNVLQGRVAPDYLWKQSLSAGVGSTLGLEYSAYSREAGQTLEYPDAVVEMHPGDWHNAMRTYADWAHHAWQWRPLSTKLNDVWRIEYLDVKPSAAATKPLFKDGHWYDQFAADDVEMGEWDSWWQWSEEGPFGVSLQKANEAFDTTLRHRIITDPATGKLVWISNRGETNRYNTSMGGLGAFKAAIRNSQKAGVLVQLYTSPMLASTGTSMAQYGPQYGVVNPYCPIKPPEVLPPPRDDYVIQYAAWRMCVDNEEYINIVAQNMARLVKDTGVDAIRLDELGFGGFVCYNPRHRHLFAEHGQHAAMRAMTELAHRIHAAVSAEKPDFVLTAEYPGADILAAQLDGALMSENRRYTFPGLRPLPVNIFRFYFSEIKLYEYRPGGAAPPNAGKIAFWNAVGTFLETYPDSYHRILKENGDAFRSRDAQPLIPTLVEGIYANRFAVPDKEITLLYNNSGTASDPAVLPADDREDRHYFDLLNGRELPVEDSAIRLNMKPDDVAAIARLPRVIEVLKTKTGLAVRLRQNVPDASIALCDRDGAELQRMEVGSTPVAVPPQEKAVYIKLFSGKYLLDASAISS